MKNKSSNHLKVSSGENIYIDTIEIQGDREVMVVGNTVDRGEVRWWGQVG